MTKPANAEPVSSWERIVHHPVYYYGACVIAAFAAGWGAYAQFRVGNSEIVTQYDYSRIKEFEGKFKEEQLKLVSSEEKLNEIKGKIKNYEKPVTIVLVDTKKRLYFKNVHSAPANGNADFLLNAIKNDDQLKLMIKAVPQFLTDSLSPQEIVNSIESNESDIIVVHRSAFSTDENEDTDKNLIEFLGKLKHLKSTFVIYSRKSNTDSQFAARIARESGITSTVYGYRFEEGNPFDKKEQVTPFMAFLKELSQARRNLFVEPPGK